MGIFYKIFYVIINIPARLKGVVFGRNSFFGPSYDFINAKMRGVKLGDDVIIGKNARVLISGDAKIAEIKIGDGTIIGRFVTIASAKNISIGKKCMLSYNVSMYDHGHVFQPNISPVDSGLTKGDPIIIEDNCFIGANVFISKGVHLGKHCVVGANSVVTKSFPDYSIIAGNPAKLISKNIMKGKK